MDPLYHIFSNQTTHMIPSKDDGASMSRKTGTNECTVYTTRPSHLQYGNLPPQEHKYETPNWWEHCLTAYIVVLVQERCNPIANARELTSFLHKLIDILFDKMKYVLLRDLAKFQSIVIYFKRCPIALRLDMDSAIKTLA